MNRWIIERYNNNQKKFSAMCLSHDKISINERSLTHATTMNFISVYDFLFDHKWGFVDAFCEDIQLRHTDDVPARIIQHNLKKFTIKQNVLQELAISKDPLKYLEILK